VNPASQTNQSLGRPAARVRIPADTGREDRLLAGLTARQLGLLASGSIACWALFVALRHALALPVLGFVLVAFAGAVCFLALGRVEGLAASRLARLALAHASAPHRLVVAPGGVAPVPGFLAVGHTPRDRANASRPAPLRLPLQGIDEDGVVDLGGDGIALVCRASAVSFSLRTAAEQEALVAGFARYLNSLEHGVQVLVRSERVELAGAIAALEEGAASLSSLALERAARGHAAFIARLGARHDLLHREVLLVLRSREPLGHYEAAGSGRAGGHGGPRGSEAVARLRRRVVEAQSSLEAAGVRLELLDGPGAVAVLSACLEPFARGGPVPAPSAGRGDAVPATPGATIRRSPA
jgi:hypothetical protein